MDGENGTWNEELTNPTTPMNVASPSQEQQMKKKNKNQGQDCHTHGSAKDGSNHTCSTLSAVKTLVLARDVRQTGVRDKEQCAIKTSKHRIISPNSVSPNALPTQTGVPGLPRLCTKGRFAHTVRKV